jgi:hypothetical protein
LNNNNNNNNNNNLFARQVVGMRKRRNVFRILVGKAEGKKHLGRPRRRWMNKFRILGWILHTEDGVV